MGGAGTLAREWGGGSGKERPPPLQATAAYSFREALGNGETAWNYPG